MIRLYLFHFTYSYIGVGPTQIKESNTPSLTRPPLYDSQHCSSIVNVHTAASYVGSQLILPATSGKVGRMVWEVGGMVEFLDIKRPGRRQNGVPIPNGVPSPLQNSWCESAFGLQRQQSLQTAPLAGHSMCSIDGAASAEGI